MGELRRIGITQRTMVLAERGESRDTLDVRLARLVWELGLTPIPLTNALAENDADPAVVLTYLSSLGLDAVVLSGGDDVGDPPARDRTERAVLALAEREGLPVLGICRGMQLLNVFLGGSLTPVDGHVATRHAIEGPAFQRREVNSFHRFAIAPDGLGPDLVALAHADDGTVEAVRHLQRPWTGMMWHPEREAPFVEEDLMLVASALHGHRP